MSFPRGPVPFNDAEVKKLREQHALGYTVGLGKVAGVMERKDIDVLMLTEPATFNLYIQALFDLQTRDEFVSSPMGYFQLAGIHDLPFSLRKKTWNNTVPANGEWGGYCRHSTVKFATWHRPYLAALEQALYLRMVDIAQSYTKTEDKALYLDAVQKFRLPYWDYYRPRDHDASFPGIIKNRQDTSFPYKFSLPQIFSLPNVMVRKYPSNEWDSMRNPLHRFVFPKNAMSDDEWRGGSFDKKFQTNTWRWTSNVKDAPVIQKAVDDMDKAIQKARAGLVTNIHHMIVHPGEDNSAYSEYPNFVTNAAQGPTQDVYGSLEQIHNNYHVMIGGQGREGGGHMATGISSFDPVFWAHHNNIDRFLAVWEAVNSSKLKGLVDDEKLFPFLKAKDTYWKSTDLHDCEALGYTYPDIDKNDGKKTSSNFNRLDAWSIPDQQDGTDFMNWTPPEAPKERQPLDLSPAWVYSDTKIGYRKLGVPFKRQPVADRFAMSRKQAAVHTSGNEAGAKSGIVSAASNTVSGLIDTVASKFPLSQSNPDNKQVPLGFQAEHAPAAPAPASATSPKTWQWYVDMEVERLALNGPFGIYYFIGAAGGAVEVLPDDYLIAPTLAAFSYNFTSKVETCENCAEHAAQHTKITSTEVLTPILLDYVKIGDLRSLEPADVEAFLIDRLRWRVSTIEGDKKDPRELSERHGLKLHISSTVIEGAGAERQLTAGQHDRVIEQIIANASTSISTGA